MKYNSIKSLVYLSAKHLVNHLLIDDFEGLCFNGQLFVEAIKFESHTQFTVEFYSFETLDSFVKNSVIYDWLIADLKWMFKLGLADKLPDDFIREYCVSGSRVLRLY